MAQPIQTRTARRGRRPLCDRDRAGRRGREADDHPRNRQAQLQAHRRGFRRLAKNRVEPQDVARNRIGAARDRRTAEKLRATRRAIDLVTKMAALRLYVLRDAPYGRSSAFDGNKEEFLILRKPRSGCLEGRRTPIPATANFFTSSNRRWTCRLIHSERGSSG